jgi:outer membrane protein assembly factor BamB
MPGPGALFYRSDNGEFLSVGDWKPIYRRQSSADDPFPRAEVNAQGFAFTDWIGGNPMLVGEDFGSQIWQAEGLHRDPRLLLFGTLVLTLEPGPANPGGVAVTHITATDLSTGKTLFTQDLAGEFSSAESDGRDIALVNSSRIVLLEADSGRQRWEIDSGRYHAAALTSSTVIVWESPTQLVAFSRADGTLLWRIQFRSQSPLQWEF